MSRKKIVAGNWKMNQNLFEGKQLIQDILSSGPTLGAHVQVIIAPPFTQLELAAGQLKEHPGFYLAAQNCHQEKSGAYTGEISAIMLRSVQVSHVILGHSERRQYFNESNELLARKTDTVLAEDMDVIFCVGEPMQVRDDNRQNDYIKTQIQEGLFHLPQSSFKKIIIAYEPIWAIGTGRTASTEQAQDMHAFIRSVVAEQYDLETADQLSILYGGSCNPANVESLFACPDVDGGLIGGASLKAKDFCSIIAAR